MINYTKNIQSGQSNRTQLYVLLLFFFKLIFVFIYERCSSSEFKSRDRAGLSIGWKNFPIDDWSDIISTIPQTARRTRRIIHKPRGSSLCQSLPRYFFVCRFAAQDTTFTTTNINKDLVYNFRLIGIYYTEAIRAGVIKPKLKKKKTGTYPRTCWNFGTSYQIHHFTTPLKSNIAR